MYMVLRTVNFFVVYIFVFSLLSLRLLTLTLVAALLSNGKTRSSNILAICELIR